MAMGGSAPTDGDGMSTREHWDECPSVFDLRWNVCVIGCRGDPSGQAGELSGKPSMQERIMDGKGWIRLTMTM
jgi:hypothetical protein